VVRSVMVVVLALALGALPRAALAEGSVFTVRDVSVDATASGAAQARDIAIAQGQQVAFQELMHRLTRQQDWSFLPQESPDQISGLILGFEVSQEHTSSTRYIAKVIYHFKPNAVRALLRNSGIAFSEARARPALVLPVFESPSGTVLWADPNPWRAAWNAHKDLGDALVPLMLPLGDIGDSTMISAAQAKSASWADVAKLAQKYGLDRVLIADATADGAGNLNVRLTQVSANQQPTSTRFSFAGGGDLTTQLNQAVSSALNRLYEQWKAATIVSFAQQNTLVASVSFSSLDNWLAIRHSLDQAPTVTGVDLLAISPLGAQVRLHYAGTTDQLRITLAQASVALSGQDSAWQLALAGAGAGTVGPPAGAPALAPAGAPSASPTQPGAGTAPSANPQPAGNDMVDPEFWNSSPAGDSSGQSSNSSAQPVQGSVDPSLITKVAPPTEAH
jgi:hypothetical protein